MGKLKVLPASGSKAESWAREGREQPRPQTPGLGRSRVTGPGTSCSRSEQGTKQAAARPAARSCECQNSPDGLGCCRGCAEPRNRFSRREPPFVPGAAGAAGPARPRSPSQQAAAEADGAGLGFAFCPDSRASALSTGTWTPTLPCLVQSLFPAVQPDDAPSTREVLQGREFLS